MGRDFLPSIELKGLGPLLRKLESLPKELSEKVEKTVVKKALVSVKASAEAKVPVLTGKLKGSFRIRSRKKIGEIIGQVVNNAPHAALIEFGHLLVAHSSWKKAARPTWRKKYDKVQGQIIGVVPAQPFMRPAMRENAEQILSDAADALTKSLEKLAKKGIG
jgi:HK97 gp10 family phage protein